MTKVDFKVVTYSSLGKNVGNLRACLKMVEIKF